MSARKQSIVMSNTLYWRIAGAAGASTVASEDPGRGASLEANTAGGGGLLSREQDPSVTLARSDTQRISGSGARRTV